MNTITTSRDNKETSWINYKGLKCVVLCAGKGIRINRFEMDRPKTLIQIKNKPILDSIVNYWKRYANDFVFVVSYKKQYVIDFASQLPINCQFVEQKELRGIADAISNTKDFVSEHFIVVLGDCICNGNFNFPENMEQGVGVWGTNHVEDIKRSYSIKIRDDLIYKVEEKPRRVTNNLCGMGFYFFGRKVFDYVKLTKPSKLRNEIEITDVIQNMIDAGEKIMPVFFNGVYLNVTYPEDIRIAEKIVAKTLIS